METKLSSACVMTSMPEAAVRPRGAVMALSTSTMAMFGSSA